MSAEGLIGGRNQVVEQKVNANALARLWADCAPEECGSRGAIETEKAQVKSDIVGNKFLRLLFGVAYHITLGPTSPRVQTL